jgi:hypothetical protein
MNPFYNWISSGQRGNALEDGIRATTTESARMDTKANADLKSLVHKTQVWMRPLLQQIIGE